MPQAQPVLTIMARNQTRSHHHLPTTHKSQQPLHQILQAAINQIITTMLPAIPITSTEQKGEQIRKERRIGNMQSADQKRKKERRRMNPRRRPAIIAVNPSRYQHRRRQHQSSASVDLNLPSSFAPPSLKPRTRASMPVPLIDQSQRRRRSATSPGRNLPSTVQNRPSRRRIASAVHCCHQ